jgi:hypothetical protein
MICNADEAAMVTKMPYIPPDILDEPAYYDEAD